MNIKIGIELKMEFQKHTFQEGLFSSLYNCLLAEVRQENFTPKNFGILPSGMMIGGRS